MPPPVHGRMLHYKIIAPLSGRFYHMVQLALHEGHRRSPTVGGLYVHTNVETETRKENLSPEP